MRATAILEQIRKAPNGLTSKEIRGVLGCPAGTATGRTSELLKKGLVTRQGRRGGAHVLVASKPTAIKTHYVLVIDRSTSMSGDNPGGVDRRPQAAALFQKQLDELAPEEGATVSTIFFAGEQETAASHEAASVTASRGISSRYPTRHTGTALIDALVLAMGDADAADPDAARVVLAFTDGEENKSSKTWDEFKRALEIRQKVDNFTLAILVPKGSPGEDLLRRAGVPAGNVRAWDDLEVATRETTAGTKELIREQKTSGGRVRRTLHYFKADLSNLDGSLNLLTDLAGAAVGWKTEKETDVQSLLEAKTKGLFQVGEGFYQVMKRERKVPADRKLLLVDRRDGKVYADGAKTVRALCGYPEKGQIAIEPGNHGNFDVFVQSKSSKESTFRARILPRGTTVLWWKGCR